MMIYTTSKFDYSNDQYRLDAGGYTLLRMTVGRSGGAVKTATAGDAANIPAYPDREKLIIAMDNAVRAVLGEQESIEVRQDGKHRHFGEFNRSGTRDEFLQFFETIGARIALSLDLPVA